MGTSYTVKLAGVVAEDQRPRIQRAIERELDNVNSKMSTYLAGSEVSRFNASQSMEPFPVSADTVAVIAEAARIGRLSGGALDITVGGLVEAWGFGPKDQPVQAPPETELRRLKARVGWSKIKLDAEGATIRKLDPAVRIDLSAIAKGYAVDRVAEALDALGYGRYLVEAGGEVRVRGNNIADRPWRVGIEKPEEGRRGIYRVLGLENRSMATSGDYRNFYDLDGVRVAHTIDPRTARPVKHDLASVTVVAESCMAADGWATALMVLGENEGYDLALERDLNALFLVNDGQGGLLDNPTPAFQSMFGSPLARARPERLSAAWRN